MSAAVTPAGAEAPIFYDLDEHPHPPGASTALGFWLYLMSDCLIFAMLFAAYGVFGRSLAGGPGSARAVRAATGGGEHRDAAVQLHHLRLRDDRRRREEAGCGAGLARRDGGVRRGVPRHRAVRIPQPDPRGQGAGPWRSAFLSSFFTLVGTHGLHVTFGLIWIAVLAVQVRSRGLIDDNLRRLQCLSMFWHFLDVVWIGVFTFIYLLGVLR